MLRSRGLILKDLVPIPFWAGSWSSLRSLILFDPEPLMSMILFDPESIPLWVGSWSSLRSLFLFEEPDHFGSWVYLLWIWAWSSVSLSLILLNPESIFLWVGTWSSISLSLILLWVGSFSSPSLKVNLHTMHEQLAFSLNNLSWTSCMPNPILSLSALLLCDLSIYNPILSLALLLGDHTRHLLIYYSMSLFFFRKKGILD